MIIKMDEIKTIVKKYNTKLSENDIQLVCENIMELLFNHELDDTDSDDDDDGDISELDNIEVGSTSDGFFYLK
tara:strand:+ start:5166 stop:5384 length:219 start_codon:yes stop_codon:yes gene_type:complete